MAGPNPDSTQIEKAESKKREREKAVAIGISILFVLSTLVQAFLTNRKEAYGFVQSLFFFGLFHLNVILIMFLVFLVSRNLIKAYLLRRAGQLGSSLRWKLVTSLLAFSLLPSILLFAGSSYVIRQGFDRWFSGQVSRALEDAQAISDVHYGGLQNNLDFFGKKIQTEMVAREKSFSPEALQANLQKALGDYPLQSVELYQDITQAPLRSFGKEVPEWAVPRAAVESLQRAFAGESFDLIRQFGDGDLVQRVLPLKIKIDSREKNVVLVLSQSVPLGLKTRISDLRQAFLGYQQTFKLKDGLKSNYTLVLLTLFVLVLFVVSWFGLYIARSVTEPVQDLMRATEAFREGNWSYRISNALKPEEAVLNASIGADLEVLKSAFNTMAEEVGKRGRQLEKANVQLTSLVRELEERERYLEILLSSIRRGVVVLDEKGIIQRTNSEALQFSSLADPVDKAEWPHAIGRDWKKVFEGLAGHEDARTWLDEARSLGGRPLDRIFEIRVGRDEQDQMRSIRATGIGLIDDNEHSIGWLLILEDVSDAARLEKLAAWQEVARRVAHEIKNPLTPIQISADRLQRRLGPELENNQELGPVFVECVGQIQKQVRVIRDLVREFSQFAKLPEPKFRELSLSPLVEQILADYRFTHPTVDFKIFVQDPDDDMKVRADSEYLRRLIVNLADNAIHSMDEHKVEKMSFYVTLGPLPGVAGFVRIIFEDSGPGIPSSLREKIFDPYVTSKASGLGLGLPIVRRIAIEHAGRIRCEESKIGARFVLELPRLTSKDTVLPYGAITTHR
jgi:two-component system nitrogen regulation sensor histidine kinase NtrY